MKLGGSFHPVKITPQVQFIQITPAWKFAPTLSETCGAAIDCIKEVIDRGQQVISSSRAGNSHALTVRLTQLSLFTRSHATRPFSHAVKNKFITDNVAAWRQDTESTGQTRQNSTAAVASCSSQLFRPPDLLYWNLFPCMLLRVISALLAAAQHLSLSSHAVSYYGYGDALCLCCSETFSRFPNSTSS